MKRLILVAAGGLLLATANTPPTSTADAEPEGELTSVVAAEAPAPVAHGPAKPARAAKPARTHTHVAGTYPRCSATVRDRCQQGRGAVARPRHREIQLAMRAGERG